MSINCIRADRISFDTTTGFVVSSLKSSGFFRKAIWFPLGLKGNPVRVGSGPATVTGDEHRTFEPLGRMSGKAR